VAAARRGARAGRRPRDSSKIGGSAFATVGGPDLFPTLLTDEGLVPDDRIALREAG